MPGLTIYMLIGFIWWALKTSTERWVVDMKEIAESGPFSLWFVHFVCAVGFIFAWPLIALHITVAQIKVWYYQWQLKKLKKEVKKTSKKYAPEFDKEIDEL